MNTFSLNIKGRLMVFETPIIMGILNLSPESFYDGGKNNSLNNALKNCEKLVEEGATIIDIGAQSTKPGTDILNSTEEIKRVELILIEIRKKFPNTLLSIDTFKSDVALMAIDNGIDILNDISAGENDPKMIDLSARNQLPFIAMHKKGTISNMQDNPQYDNVVLEVYQYLHQKINDLKDKNVNDVILDLGFGFGKTIEHNYQLFNNLNFFSNLNAPILVGVSRKSMIYKLLETNVEHALNGTTVLNTIAIMKNASILRVHDVKEAAESIKILNYLKQY